MIYTIQLFTESWSFANPEGTDVHIVTSKEGIQSHLQTWAMEHAQVGADPSQAYAWVFKGPVPDVQEMYPDFVARLGPRGGLQMQPA